MSTLADVAPVDLSDSRSYVAGVPHAWLAHLRRHDPVHWQDEPGGPGFWVVTRHEDCVTVNRDYERFSSAAQGTMPFEMGADEIAQQSLMMLNMDPPLHTRYRRLVNKGFTPRMVRDLEESIHRSTDAIIDEVIEQGEADFVTQISAELPLQVIAELLGVPQEDRHRMFDWSNRMVGNEDPEYQADAEMALNAAMDLYAYAAELFGKKRIDPHADLMSVLTTVEVEGERLSDLELELFFLLLTVAGNETTRNLMSGAMHAFFQHPDAVGAPRRGPQPPPDRRGRDAALRDARHELPPHRHVRRRAERHHHGRRGQGRLLPHVGQPGRGRLQRPRRLRHRAGSQPAHRLRGWRAPLLPRGQPGPHGDPRDVRAPARPPARHPAERRGAAPAVPVHQRRQASPGGVQPFRPRRLLSRPAEVGGIVARRAPDAMKEVIRDFRRDQIMDTARSLFGELGTTDVSMDEIAAEAGVARSTLYVYFANRDELLRACVQSMYDRLQDTVDVVLAGRASPPDRLWGLILGLLECIDENPAFFRLAMATQATAAAEGSAAVGGALMLIGLDMIRVLEEVVVAGVAAGDFRADLDPERAVVLIGQQIYGALSVRAGEPDPIPAPEAAEEICDLLRRGLGG